jgi:hypothetical protein
LVSVDYQEQTMSSKHNKGKTIWDVIFSLDSSEFPIQRNYLQEPRGSLNPINSRVNSDVCKDTIKKIKEIITDPYDLYALDFELNFMIRKLADFTLFADWGDIEGYLDGDGCPIPDHIVSELENFLIKWGEDKYVCLHDLAIELLCLEYDRECLRSGNCDFKDHHEILRAANLQNAVQYIIENIDLDWRTKAEAFLRASSIRNYTSADDETIIYLMAQNIKDEQLEKESKHRWRHYQKEWGEMFFTEHNPFSCDFIPDRLRLIHWDKLNSLRFMEPHLTSEIRDTYTYKSQAQHLFSKDYLSDYARVFSLFRTDLNVDPIRNKLPTILAKFHSYLSGTHYYEYNYTASDVYFLSDVLFNFLQSRIQCEISGEDIDSRYFYKMRNEVEFNFRGSTADFIKDIPMVTLISLEIHTVFYVKPAGMVPFLQKAKEWLLTQQTPYGYWYDGINNPEYTTVLVLDAINLIDGDGQPSFPIKTVLSFEDDQVFISYSSSYQNVDDSENFNKTTNRVLYIDSERQVITYRGKEIRFGGEENWQLLQALIKLNGSVLKHEKINELTGRSIKEIPLRIGELKKYLKNSQAEFLAKAIKNQRNIGYYFDESELETDIRKA